MFEDVGHRFSQNLSFCKNWLPTTFNMVSERRSYVQILGTSIVKLKMFDLHTIEPMYEGE